MASTATTRRISEVPVSLTPLIGREDEVRRVCALLRGPSVRLLTLTGPGGVGKTRLALRIAEELAADFADGVVFVSLAPIADPALVLPTIAQAFDVREVGDQPLRDRLAQILRNRRRLLVLDNLEQVVAAAPDMGSLVDGCPRLSVLVTSRVSLSVSGEQEFPVTPLAVPDGTSSLPEVLAHNPAVKLFVQRACAVAYDFALTERNAAVIAEICRCLDGLPLAIELAAARAKVLSPQAMLARLADRLAFLTGGARDQPARLQTIRSAIAWSHDLLTSDEQALFRRLAVFVGGFTLEAAEAICQGTGTRTSAFDCSLSPVPSVFDGVASLVDKNLVRRIGLPDGDPRFAMLETIRDFGLERLAASGEEEMVRDRHAQWGQALLEEAATHTFEPEYGRWLDQFDAEHDNLRAALRWYEQTGRTEHVARLIGVLWAFWFARGFLSEGRDWVARTRRTLGSALPERASLRAELALAEGWLAVALVDYAGALAGLEEAREAWQALGDDTKLAYALFGLGVAEQDQGHADRAVHHFEAALALFRRLKSPIWIGTTLDNLGLVVARAGDPVRGQSLIEEGVAIHRAYDYHLGVAIGLRFLAQVMRLRGDDAGAAERYKACLATDPEHTQPWHLPNALEGLAGIAADHGRAALAARLLAAAEALRQSAGVPLEPALRPAQDRVLAGLQATLGEHVFAGEWSHGQRLTYAEMLAAAQSVTALETTMLASAPLATVAGAGLSARERDVLRLVAAGQSNQEIAATLGISVVTVKTHVANILGKLHLSSRAAVAAYAHRHGLG